MATAAELMEIISKGGRRSYEEDGFVAPVAFVFNAEGVGLALQPTPSDTERPPYLLGRMVSLSLPLMHDARYIGAAAEGWSKQVKVANKEEGEKQAEAIQQGDLQKWHDEGDESVKTSIIALCLDMEQPSKSLHGHVIDPRTTAQVEAKEAFEWDTDMGWIEGWPEGAFADTLRESYLHTKAALGMIPEELKGVFDALRGEERTVEAVVAWVGSIAQTGALQGAFWFGPDGHEAAIKVVRV